MLSCYSCCVSSHQHPIQSKAANRHRIRFLQLNLSNLSQTFKLKKLFIPIVSHLYFQISFSDLLSTNPQNQTVCNDLASYILKLLEMKCKDVPLECSILRFGRQFVL